ncbi:zinc-binding dehydrogenase domain-containing protein [Rhizoctonia solani AG-1 IA]|uniref:Zinc-binding dehydrogenase domain-containing protein n=1 Tax=Thanatephorus cucumeris (strain AG1-IA) TaxID=983506 RepID=L8WF15_THACA|nr:zinc-binding dehydrogenase domain-containing protein [Rhizoctonia solani AG-1 IA]
MSSTPIIAQAWRYPVNLEAWNGHKTLELRDVEITPPKRDEVLVRLHAAALNYSTKVYRGIYSNGPDGQGHVPLSDGAGEVVAVGEGVTQWKKGDRVHSLFFETWCEGPNKVTGLGFPAWILKSKTSGSTTGCLTQYRYSSLMPVIAYTNYCPIQNRIFDAKTLLPIPSHLSYEEAATIPCAALTAWHSFFEKQPITKDSTVLVLGSGGVSVFGAQLAKATGARVIATTSSTEKEDKYKSLGVDDVINYREIPQWWEKVRELTGGQGVEQVLEVGETGSVARQGIVHVIGALAQGEPTGETVQDVASALLFGQMSGTFVGSKVMCERLDAFIAEHKIKPVVDRVFGWAEVHNARGTAKESNRWFGGRPCREAVTGVSRAPRDTSDKKVSSEPNVLASEVATTREQGITRNLAPCACNLRKRRPKPAAVMYWSDLPNLRAGETLTLVGDDARARRRYQVLCSAPKSKLSPTRIATKEGKNPTDTACAVEHEALARQKDWLYLKFQHTAGWSGTRPIHLDIINSARTALYPKTCLVVETLITRTALSTSQSSCPHMNRAALINMVVQSWAYVQVEMVILWARLWSITRKGDPRLGVQSGDVILANPRDQRRSSIVVESGAQPKDLELGRDNHWRRGYVGAQDGVLTLIKRNRSRKTCNHPSTQPNQTGSVKNRIKSKRLPLSASKIIRNCENNLSLIRWTTWVRVILANAPILRALTYGGIGYDDLCKQGQLHRNRFLRLGNLDDIEKAIEYGNRSLDLITEEHPDIANRLTCLGSYYGDRHRRLRHPDDWKKSFEYFVRAAGLTPENDPNLPGRLSNLGISYDNRYQQAGDVADLEKAIECHSRALALTPDGHPDLPRRHAALGVLYTDRYQRMGDITDLEKAIECDSHALALTPDGHPDLPRHHAALGVPYGHRYQRMGDITDLEKAIECQSRALALTPDGHPDLPDRHGQLGLSYGDRYRRMGDITDLEKVIEHLSRALALTPDGHPDLPRRHGNLGGSYRDRYRRMEDITDLEKAIECESRALALTPDGHPYLPHCHAALGASYTDRFQRMWDITALEKTCHAAILL